MPSSSPTPLSGPKFAEFAVVLTGSTLRESLALDVRSDSQQTLNEWLRQSHSFPWLCRRPLSSLARSGLTVWRARGWCKSAARPLPTSLTRCRPGPASLMVTPDSVAVASGGVEVDFKKVSFHYSMVEGYKVVTWSVHGLTYALVSQEGNSTQRSCMVCHSAMRDRDLSQTPTPFAVREMLSARLAITPSSIDNPKLAWRRARAGQL